MSDRFLLTDGAGNVKGALFYDSAADEVRIASYDANDPAHIDGYIAVSSSGLGGGTGVSGTWTPTGAILSNLDSLTPLEGQYVRMGNIVFGSVLVTADPTASGAISFTLTTPITTAFTGADEAAGVAVINPENAAGIVVSTASGTLLTVNVANTSTSSSTVAVHFSYQVLS
jgi:hypothetical protein